VEASQQEEEVRENEDIPATIFGDDGHPGTGEDKGERPEPCGEPHHRLYQGLALQDALRLRPTSPSTPPSPTPTVPLRFVTFSARRGYLSLSLSLSLSKKKLFINPVG
jgi:hypothetical protein